MPHERFVGGVDDDPAWLGVDVLLVEPTAIDRLVRAASGRFGSDDRALVLAQVAREAISVLVTVGVHAWAAERRVPDLTAANVVVREGPTGVVVGLRRPEVPDVVDVVDVVDDVKLFRRLLDRVLGEPLPLGALPSGPADQVAAVATVVATVRHTMRTGNRHLWGTAALAAASTLTRLGPRADADRARLLAARPDLARTIELVAVPDADDVVTFPIRRTCCLLLKLPAGHQCGTCSLRPRDDCVARMTAWALRSRV
ncbi:MAG TPA: hypothetical protein VK611_18620 [Acidimicrobiales bacterium]|nr:hypothetical protein [Acidimicrobiales bacterium]